MWIGAVVADDEARIHADAPALVLDGVGVGVAADVVRGFEHRDVVIAAKMVRGDVSGNAAADDGDLHEHSCPARVGAAALPAHCCGTGSSCLMSYPSRATRSRRSCSSTASICGVRAMTQTLSRFSRPM